MPASPDMIRTERINMVFHGKADGIALQQEMAAWCRTELNPAIERLLAAYAVTEEWITLDLITVDVDIQHGQDWKQILTEAVIGKLKNSIPAPVIAAVTPLTTQQDHFVAILRWYLLHGVLPWNADYHSKPAFESALSNWLDAATQDEVLRLLHAVQYNANAVERLVHIMPATLFVRFAVLAGGLQQYAVVQAITAIAELSAQLASDQQEQQRLVYRFKVAMIQAVLSGLPGPVISLAAQSWINSNEVKTVYSQKGITPGAMIHQLVRQAPQLFSNMPTGELHTGNQQAVHETAAQAGDAIAQQRVKEAAQAFSLSMAEGVFIHNAGAVIIAPFLPALFQRAGLLQDQQITDAPLALSLLYYCIHGNAEPAEFELVLLKILCGIAPDTVVAAAPLSNAALQAEADEMLTSVIAHWQVLKDTGINALREAFLQRNGKLRFAQDTWVVQVEQQSYDILLQQLPWTIQMIRLPWMQHMLQTEWI